MFQLDGHDMRHCLDKPLSRKNVARQLENAAVEPGVVSYSCVYAVFDWNSLILLIIAACPV
jgi:hypothetical protein